MLYASQLTARHLDQLEQKGDLMGNQQKETEPAKALIDIIIIIGTKCFLLGSHKNALRLLLTGRTDTRACQHMDSRTTLEADDEDDNANGEMLSWCEEAQQGCGPGESALDLKNPTLRGCSEWEEKGAEVRHVSQGKEG